MKPLKIFFILIIQIVLLGLSSEIQGEDIIQNYSVYFGVAVDKSSAKKYILLRKFTKFKKTFYLAVDPEIMVTSVINSDNFDITVRNFDTIKNDFKKSSYVKSVNYACTNSKKLLNAGITHFISKEKGIVLSIDLCPSKNGLDRELFYDLYSTFKKNNKAIPISIAITGRFIKKHQGDLLWLIEEHARGALNINWVNHTYHHRYSKELPAHSNFLLKEGTKIDEEILKTEALLLSYDVVPSAFFRFPGLISNDSVFNAICAYGLIPVGGDFWLWKKKLPHDGSIILVHANGNDRPGIVRFRKFLKNQAKSIENNEWKILDLRESIIDFIKGSMHKKDLN